MILPDSKLLDWAKHGLNPFEPMSVNPASVDLRLGNEFINLATGERFTAESITISPGDAILATTLEYLQMPNQAAGALYLKSSVARQGLDHALAGWVDPGFCGELTMELHAHRPVTLHYGQRVVQLVLFQMAEEPLHPYDGRYQNQTGPTEARE